jgi:hypothetical protein
VSGGPGGGGEVSGGEVIMKENDGHGGSTLTNEHDEKTT